MNEARRWKNDLRIEFIWFGETSRIACDRNKKNLNKSQKSSKIFMKNFLKWKPQRYFDYKLCLIQRHYVAMPIKQVQKVKFHSMLLIANVMLL